MNAQSVLKLQIAETNQVEVVGLQEKENIISILKTKPMYFVFQT